MTHQELKQQMRQVLDPHNEIPNHIWNPWVDEAIAEEFSDNVPDSVWNERAQEAYMQDACEKGVNIG